MPIEMICPWCSKKIKAPDALAGKSAKCPGCQGVVTVPSPDGPAAGSFGPPPPFNPQMPSQFAPPQQFGPPAQANFGGGAQPPVFDAEDYSTEPAPAAQPEGEQRRPCPACGEMILTTAVKCRYCGEVFDSTLRRSAKVGGRAADNDEMSGFDWFLALLCPGVGCIVAIARLIQGKKSAGKMLGISLAMIFAWNMVRFFLEQVGNGPGR